jgi:hypothetical protein
MRRAKVLPCRSKYSQGWIDYRDQILLPSGRQRAQRPKIPRGISEPT